MRVWAVLCLAACGRIGFGLRSDAAGDGRVDDTIAVDGIMANAPCGMPIQIGTGDVATTPSAAVGASSYRVAWLDGAGTIHLIGIERSGDAIATGERTFPPDTIPSPLGTTVVLVGDFTIIGWWDAANSEQYGLVGPQLAESGGSHGANFPVSQIVRSGTQLYALWAGSTIQVGTLTLTTTASTPNFTYGAFMMIDNQRPQAASIAPAGGDGLLVVTSRPVLKDCSVWTLSSGLAVLGTAAVPNDGTRCDEIHGAYAPTANTLAAARLHAVLGLQLDPLSATAQPGTAVTLASAIQGFQIAGIASTFYVVYQPSSQTYRLAKVSSMLAMESDTTLHVDATPLRSATVAPGDAEGLAVWATTTTPNQLWMERLCP